MLTSIIRKKFLRGPEGKNYRRCAGDNVELEGEVVSVAPIATSFQSGSGYSKQYRDKFSLRKGLDILNPA